MTTRLCSHCLLPLGLSRHDAQVAGDNHQFCCYGCCLAFQVTHGETEEADAAWLLIRLGVGAFLSMNVMMFSLLLYSDTLATSDDDLRSIADWVMFALATPAVAILGAPFLHEAWRDAAERRLGTSALITLGVAAAYFYSVVALVGGAERVYFDTATMVLVFFTLGRYLEAAGRARAMRSIAPMLAPEREIVTVIEGGAETRRPVREIRAGMKVLVRPGERIGIDGVVIEGTSHVGEAIVTGESRPVAKRPGAEVLAGSINHEGPLLLLTDRDGYASRWIGVARSVREALQARSHMQQLAETVGGAFVPIVLVLALAVAAHWAQSRSAGDAMLAGLAVLVVACPCALGIAAPLATSIGIGLLARRGCLVRGGDVLEALASLRGIAFDKTGTLTLGEPRVFEIVSNDGSDEDLLALAAALEARSEHPLAKGVRLEAEQRGLRLENAANIRAYAGRGITGEVAGVRAAAGSANWLAEQGFALPSDLAQHAGALEAGASSLIFVGHGLQVIGVIALKDPLRPEAPEIVAAIEKLGIETLLLSGDRPSVVARVGCALGIGRVESGMSPEAKQAFITGEGGKKWAMVGDGLNDAPVLAAASVGIAVGSATDLAREAAGFVLPPGGIAPLPYAIRLSRAVRRTVIANLFWAFGYNAVAMTLAATGHLRPVFAAALMAGSSLIVVLNSLRLEGFSGEPTQVAPGGITEKVMGMPALKDV